ncbi:AIR synthase-related protein, partial [Nitrospira sp. BLG_2]|uniref:AIR synthase-related protein n=1 Tax=Nitrospira sp. BLG_2 TaxID=3397507 RepID=UPI003B9A5590
VGIIERDRIVDGRSIAEGDVIVGLGSSGLHTNGYSLVRRVLADNPGLLETEVNGRPVLDVLLDVHRPYYPALKPLFEMKAIKGAAHITGGGIAENLNRILPNNVDAAVRLERYRPAAIFNLLREAGSISDADMLRTFNLGVGMALVVSSDELEATLNSLKQSGCPAFEIGSIVPGSGHVQLRGHIGWR